MDIYRLRKLYDERAKGKVSDEVVADFEKYMFEEYPDPFKRNDDKEE